MSLSDVFIGQQSWANYISNRDLADRFEKSLTNAGDQLVVQLGRSDGETVALRGLGSLEDSLATGLAELQYELQDASAGIAGLRADFHILMGDAVWELEKQTSVLNGILHALQAPLDTASKELRARAEDAFRNGWYEEALSDFLQSEQKNYQDFAVHRSLGNIYFYKLVDLRKASEYFQKAAKYARPRDSKQAAEAEFFVGMVFGVQQDYESALRHIREATSLNQNFFEADYKCASFAGLLGYSHEAVERAERAILGDARYYERCRDDACFDRVRSDLNLLLARLLQTQEAETRSSIVEFHRVLKAFGGMGIADAVLQRWTSRLQEIESIQDAGHYVALRTATLRTFEDLRGCLKDGVANTEQLANSTLAEIAGLRSGLTRQAEAIEASLKDSEYRKNYEGSPIGGIAILSLGILGLSLGILGLIWGAGAITTPQPRGGLGALAILVGGCFIWVGGSVIWGGVCAMPGQLRLHSEITKLRSLEEQVRVRLLPGRDDAIHQLQSRLNTAQQNRDVLIKMLADLLARQPASNDRGGELKNLF